MSDIICDCPLEDGVPSIPNENCPESYGLIGKVVFGRIGNSFLDEADYDTEASWTTRLAAVDNTQISITPLFNAPELAQSEPITFGGDDNTTFSGAPIITGQTSVSFTFQFYDLPQSQYEALTEYLCYAASGQLGIIMIGDNFSRYQNLGTDVAPLPDFIPVTNAFMGTVGLGGRTEPNQNQMTLTLGAGWQEGTRFFKHVNFNPINLTNP